MDSASSTRSTIIGCIVEDAVNIIYDYYMTSFEKDDVVGHSVLIDSSKVASVVQVKSRYKHVVGGAAENHYIP